MNGLTVRKRGNPLAWFPLAKDMLARQSGVQKTLHIRTPHLPITSHCGIPATAPRVACAPLKQIRKPA